MQNKFWEIVFGERDEDIFLNIDRANASNVRNGLSRRG